MMAWVRAAILVVVPILVATSGCGGVGDVCSATAGDFAGTYQVETWQQGSCDCRDRATQTSNCAEKCADDITNNGFVCDNEGAFCHGLRKTKYPTTFVIGADGVVSLTTRKEVGTNRTESLVCDVASTSFCDLSFTCADADGGGESIKVIWKKVE